jgi:hypothetical protein
MDLSPRPRRPGFGDQYRGFRVPMVPVFGLTLPVARATQLEIIRLVRRMDDVGGWPSSPSNRAKALNGDVVSTPPKSQITASIGIFVGCHW